jgi:cytochrome P450/NADPH-cytochrome P450 reductase
MEPIPGPPGLPFIGNMSDLDPNNPLQSLRGMSDKYGPIFKFTIAGSDRTVVTSQALCNEVCDEKRFSKIVSAGLNEIRNGGKPRAIRITRISNDFPVLRSG